MRARNWTAVCSELLIVIAGVLIGFELQDWRNDLSDQSAYVEYLHRIDANLALSMEMNRNFKAEASRNGERAQDAVAMLEECYVPSGSEDDFASALFLLGKASMPMLRSDTIDEMRAVGKGDLFDDDLKTAIGKLEQDQLRSDALERQIDLRMASQLDLVNRQVRFNLSKDAHPNAPIKSDAATYDFPALCGDTAFINAVSALAELDYRVATANAKRLKNQATVRAMVRAHIRNFTNQN